jgi:membrane protein implicated in regulation of membrane protease activity
MAFRFYSDTFSQATRGVAAFVLTVGLLLIGFGVVIIAFPEIFAFLAALVFFIAGISCAAFALKMFLAFRKMRRDQQSAYRDNVRIHELDDFDGD